MYVTMKLDTLWCIKVQACYLASLGRHMQKMASVLLSQLKHTSLNLATTPHALSLMWIYMGLYKMWCSSKMQASHTDTLKKTPTKVPVPAVLGRHMQQATCAEILPTYAPASTSPLQASHAQVQHQTHVPHLHSSRILTTVVLCIQTQA